MGGRKTILIVEDDPIEAITEADVIRRFGYTVLTTGSGEEAIPLVLGRPDIDLILMDIELGGGIDGGECAKRILAKRSLPIVFLTSHTENVTVEKVRGITRYGYVFKDSGEAVLQSSLDMAFDLFEARENLTNELVQRKHMQAALREREERYQSILNTATDGFFLVDLQGKILEVNQSFCTMTGYSAEELLTMSVQDVEAAESPADVAARVEALKSTGDLRFESKHRRKDGSVFDVDVSVQYREAEGGYLVGFTKDITDRKNAERAIEDEVRRRKLLFEEAPDGILIIEPATARFLEFNTAAHMQLGYTREEFARLSIGDVEAMETPDETHVRIADVLKDGRADFDTLQKTKQGDIRNVHVTAQIVMVKGLPVYYCFWRDVTDRKQAQEANRKLLAEKELLLKEVHHRIKNNITLVQSLLSLQAAAVKDPTAKAALNDSKARLQSMMLLYDRLYRSERFSDLLIDEYLETLLDGILANFPNRGGITVEKHLESFMMDAKRLSSIGIIVNELITNIMKHAFPGRKGGRITVWVSKKGKRVTLSIGDDGVGIATPVKLESSPGFGLQLVGILTEQVDGTIRAVSRGGTTWVLEFDV